MASKQKSSAQAAKADGYEQALADYQRELADYLEERIKPGLNAGAIRAAGTLDRPRHSRAGAARGP